MFKFSMKHPIAIVIGVPIFFLLHRFLSVQIIGDTYLTLSYAVLVFFAVVYGPFVGLFIGLLGRILVDFAPFMGFSWGWIIASAIIGFAFGLIFKPGTIEAGLFGKTEVIRFVMGSFIIFTVSWVIITPLISIFINDIAFFGVLVQGLVAASVNFAITALVGTVGIFIFAKTRP